MVGLRVRRLVPLGIEKDTGIVPVSFLESRGG